MGLGKRRFVEDKGGGQGEGGGEVAKGERMQFFYYSPFPKKHILRLLFWDIFEGTALKLKQVYRLTFSSFNNCPSYAIRWLPQMTRNSNCFKTKI